MGTSDQLAAYIKMYTAKAKDDYNHQAKLF